MAAKSKGKAKKVSARTKVRDLRVHKGHSNKVKGGMAPGPETLPG